MRLKTAGSGVKLPPIVFFLCALLPTVGFGVDQISLEKVLDAVDASPGIELQRIQFQIKSLQVDDSRNALSPIVELKASQNFLESDNFNEPSDLTLSVRKPIHTWGALESKILAAEIDQEASRLAVEAVRMQVRRQAIENYFAAVVSVRILDHLSAATETLKEYEDLIRNRVQQQVSPKIDLELVVSRLARNEAKRIEISRQLEDARTQIRQLTGVSVDRFEVPLCHPASQVVRDREVAIGLARQNSSHLRYLESVVASQSEMMTAIRQGRLPQVDIGVELQSDEYSSRPEYGGFVSLNYQFKGSENQIALFQQETRVREARIALEMQERQLTAEIEVLLNRLSVGSDHVEALSQVLVSKEEEVASFFKQFGVGKRKWDSVLSASYELTDARIELEQEIWKHCMAKHVLSELTSENTLRAQ